LFTGSHTFSKKSYFRVVRDLMHLPSGSTHVTTIYPDDCTALLQVNTHIYTHTNKSNTRNYLHQTRVNDVKTFVTQQAYQRFQPAKYKLCYRRLAVIPNQCLVP